MISYFRLAAIGLLLTAFSTSASADYLDVQRAATIRKSPSTDAAILAHPDVGTHLAIVGNGTQKQGYYHVTEPTSQKPGWIYHTLVKVQPGDMPGATVTPPTPTPMPAPTPTAPVAANDVMRVHYINMGQGNSTLLEFACGAVLIDAGGQNQTTTDGLVAYLKAFFARRTDLHNTISTILITHTHIDHNRALESVVENFTVDNYVFNGHTAGSGSAGAKWMLAHANDNGRHVNIETVTEATVDAVPGHAGLTDSEIDPVHCAGTDPSIKIISSAYATNPGWSALVFKNENNASMVIRVDFGQSSFLFPGDQEDDAITTMVNKYAGTQMLRADVYEVGHHGSYNGTNAAQVAAIAPKIAVFSSGDPTDHSQWTAWQYGHPRKVTVDILANAVTLTRPLKSVAVATAAKVFVNEDMTKALYDTGWDGTVDITADQTGHYTVATEH
jgi:beta-lactamase superfamily II metal-dependent hydrolase